MVLEGCKEGVRRVFEECLKRVKDFGRVFVGF
jgi:hypothetical protein